jgi:hypothetical protein
MKRNASDSGDILDRAVREIRSMSVSSEEEDSILARVKSALTADMVEEVPSILAATAVEKPYLTCCEDFVSLIPDYLASRLTPSRTLLLQDHLMECAVCWKVFEAGHSTSKPSAVQPAAKLSRVKPATRFWKIAAAAACLLIAIAVARTSVIRNFVWPIDVSANVESADGKVYSVVWNQIQPLKRGQYVRYEAIRTGPASHAVIELQDGSRIEMNERTELRVYRAPDGAVISLDRGNVIVAAAKQHGGHLYVKTADAKVTIVGTMFAVTAAAKGSRVSVIEGQVQVQYPGNSKAVRAGEQISTSPAVPMIGVADEIAWSRNLNQYTAMLQEFSSTSQAAAQSLAIAGLRYQSSLIPVVPQDTVLIASFPNVDGSILQSYGMMKARISENTILEQWWQQREPGVEAMIGVASRNSRYFGPEIVVAVPLSRFASPVVLANAVSPDALAADLRNDPRVAGGLVAAAVNGGLMVLSSSAAQIQQTLAYQAQFGTNPFQSTALYQRLAQSYTEGAGWLLAADLERIVAQDPSGAAELPASGLQGMQQLVVEQKTGSSGPAFFQTLGFKGARTGMTSWLGGPSTMGTLDFVSPSAYTAAGVVTKDPNLILDDIFAMLSTVDDSARALAEIENFQKQNNVDIRRDIVGALGNEFLVAIDGPILPSPSWKVVIEVTDPGRLQNALSWSFNELNRQAALENKPKWTVTSDNSGGWTSYRAVLDGVPAEIDYGFIGGYLVIAPQRTFLLDAGRYWSTGASLGKSADFRQQLPADGRTDFSGFVYHNIKSLADSVPGGLLSGVNVKFPRLVCLYGYPDRIVMSSKGVLGTDIVSAEGLGVLSAAIGGRR